ncbi:MAG TPA: potassium/proton antiporter [Candidatus Eisenbacteria bacterium]|nr:potassium/proton antiporter [Candidatus Eisenbacteria bacterium]
MSIEHILIAVAVVVLLSVFASRASEKYGVPALLLFLFLGMLAGSEGPGGIHFDNPWLAQALGVTALSFILFSGGLDTQWSEVRSVSARSFVLSTVGVAVTAGIIGLFAFHLLGFSVLEGLLLGSIISSTDAAAVFSVLRSRNIGLPDRVKNLLELESGSNDPMAVFLTVAVINLLMQEANPYVLFIQMFVMQMTLGALLGFVLGRLLVWVINHIRLESEGLYPVLTLASVLFIYGGVAFVGGNGFLGIYVAGLVVGNKSVVHKKSLLRFHDALAWLMQIVMFLILGLQVFPSELIPVAGSGLLLSAVLMLLARPVAVFLCLSQSAFSLKEKTLVAWVGLRGAVPIILATFPLLAELDGAARIFNLVFFIVITSVLFQGTFIPAVVRLLGLAIPRSSKPKYPLEFEEGGATDATLMDFVVPYNAAVIGKSIVELGLPEETVITLIVRGDKYVLPTGTTTLESGDVLLVLLRKASIAQVATILTASNP